MTRLSFQIHTNLRQIDLKILGIDLICHSNDTSREFFVTSSGIHFPKEFLPVSLTEMKDERFAGIQIQNGSDLVMGKEPDYIQVNDFLLVDP